MSIDRPFLGASLTIGFCALAPLADALAKLIGDAVPLGQIVLVRFAMQALILWPLARRAGVPLRVPPRLWRLLLWRTFLHIAGIWMMVLSLRHLPLADAIAIAYVMPFMLLLLGHLVLGEAVGTHRMATCIVGFGGTLLVMQPSLADVGWVAALPLVVALIFALFILATRQIAGQMDPMALQAITGVLGTVLLFPLIVLADGRGWSELDPVSPHMRELVLLGALGVLGTLAHLLMTWSLRFAPAATLAPIQYLEIPFAVLYGWIIFSQWPNGLARIGIVIVMAAGLYIVWRERHLSRASRPKPPRSGPPVVG